MKLKNYSKSVIGLVRKANEDSIGSLTNKETNGNGDVFVVCDGMGGHVGGATASQNAVKVILNYFKDNPHPNPIIALEKSISLANEKIFLLSREKPDLKGMGTTCVVLINIENSIYIAHVGDSRIYLHSDNKLYRLTKDHSFVQKLVDAGQLEDFEMESHPRKNELTKALGIANSVVVEVAEKPIYAKKGDKFLLCSDGLSGLVNDMTILNTINNTSGDDTVNELIQLAENAGGNDNISVDIVEVVNSSHIKSSFIDQGNKSNIAEQTQIITDKNLNSNDKFVNNFLNYKKPIIGLLFLILLGLVIVFVLRKSCDNNDQPIEKTVSPVDGVDKDENKIFESESDEKFDTPSSISNDNNSFDENWSSPTEKDSKKDTNQKKKEKTKKKNNQEQKNKRETDQREKEKKVIEKRNIEYEPDSSKKDDDQGKKNTDKKSTQEGLDNTDSDVDSEDKTKNSSN